MFSTSNFDIFLTHFPCVHFQVETGPLAAQFALLGVGLVELIHCWKILVRPWYGFLRHFILTIFLFLLGLLPWLDNYANAGSFVSGILLSFVLIPCHGFESPSVSTSNSNTVSFNQSFLDTPVSLLKPPVQNSRRTRCLTILICFGLWISLASALAVLFVWGPIVQCELCSYFTCLPLTPNMCDNLQVNVNQRTDCIAPSWN